MRQFLALDTGDALRRAVAELRAEFEPREPSWRWVRPEAVHLTLRFLGEVDEALDRSARPRWRRAAGEIDPFRIAFGGVGRFPPRGPSRVLWVGVDEPDGRGALAALAAALERAAREVGFAGERRSFRPHVTIARARGADAPRFPRGAVLAPVALLHVRQLLLLESRLAAGGARYTGLDAFPLGAGTEHREGKAS